LSTNCVFKEDRGHYLDTDIPDGDTWYAKTKAMGEIKNEKDLTIRLSIIGNELKSNGSGLFEWFMRQTGTIGGYSRVYWNGITCLCLAQNIEKMIEANVTGLYQLAPSYSIDKYSLCLLFKKIWNKDIIIEPNDSIKKNLNLFFLKIMKLC
jgi:dTDP-4-dehydrorhamnose reductase